MSAPIIQGWCPGAHKPMASGDGLVVRIRPPLGEITARQAHTLADLAEHYGNGLMDLTNRANLQLRGVKEADHATLIADLISLGLVDEDAELEARRNLVLTPFRDAGDRVAEIAQALATGLTDPAFAPLPSKFGFVVDTGPARDLATTSGDIRIEASNDALIVRADGQPTGRKANSPSDAARLALDLARWFITAGGVGPDGRGRMAGLIVRGTPPPPDLTGDLPPNPATNATDTRRSQRRAERGAGSLRAQPEGNHPPPPGPKADGLLIAAAFGQLTPDDLRQLAGLAATTLRLTPWRMVFLPGITTVPTLTCDTLSLAPDNPLLRIDACTGAPGCPQASVETRNLSRALADNLPANQTLHVSGCSKGCARQSPADVVLVGKDGGFDLVTQGRPCDAPSRIGLSPRQALLQTKSIFET